MNLSNFLKENETPNTRAYEHALDLAYLFVNDNDRIAAAIIQILYMLRCCLAHGDITPDKKTSDVYRYAYEVLLCPLKKLK